MPQEHLGSVHSVTVHLMQDPFAYEIFIQKNLVKKSACKPQSRINIVAVPTTVHQGVI